MEKKREYQSESPVVKEVREARRQVWADYGNDLERVLEAVRKGEEERLRQGYKFADLHPTWEMPEEVRKEFEQKQKLKQNK